MIALAHAGSFRQPWTKSDAGYRTVILPQFAVDMLIHHDTFSVEAGLRHGHGLLSLATPPTAVVAGNDEIAIGVLAAVS
jgi:DNA-binding LacI/PurR family transcriptional regulator